MRENRLRLLTFMIQVQVSTFIVPSQLPGYNQDLLSPWSESTTGLSGRQFTYHIFKGRL